MSGRPARRPRSITVPIVLLVIAAVAIASAVQFAITFSGPPPFAPPMPISLIARALHDGKVPPQAARRLTLSNERIESLPIYGGYSPSRDALIARTMGVPPGEVRGVYQAARGPARDAVFGDFAVEWRSPAGIRVVRSVRPWFTAWHRVTLVSTLAVLLALGLAAWWIARAISRPISRLAAAAGEARLGSRTPIPHEGPREIRELSHALEAMQSRLLEQAEGRTAMLAAIAHDLGTPLSRIAFWIEQLPEEARNRAAADIDEMRAMLGEVLRLARESRADSRSERIDLGSLVESLADDLAGAGMDVRVKPGPRAVVAGDSQALRRLFVNLAENGVRYGKRATIAWTHAPGWAEVTVDDEGPGFGPDREALFAPFVRGEGSRNRATGGTGLGLAIVRGIAEAHGGEVFLEDRQGGGRVRVRLPAE